MQTELRWIVPATVIVAIEQVACLAFGITLHVRGWPPFLNYGHLAVLAGCVTFATLGIHALLQCLTERPESPLAHVMAYFRRRRVKLAVFMWGVVLAWLQLCSLTWTKSLMPIAGPLWADHFLAGLDHRMFGTDTWRIVVPMLSPVGRGIDVLYSMWLPLLSLTLAAVLYAAPSRQKSQAALSFFTIATFTGVVGQFLLPSGGPIYWARMGFGDRFAALPSEGHALQIANYLWDRYAGNVVDFATGISAFPSMHVALTAWMVIAVHSVMPKLRPVAWFYFLVVLLGSVYLGWHYLVDGLGGVAGAIACWFVAAKMVDLLPTVPEWHFTEAPMPVAVKSR